MKNKVPSVKGEYKWIPIDSITSFVGIRRVLNQGIEILKEKIKSNGFIPTSPIMVQPFENGYMLIDGRYRFEAAKKLGYKELPAVIVSDDLSDNGRKAYAIRINKTTEALIPTNFVDTAEFIWEEAEIKTQQEIAEILEWSRGQVSNYIALKAICPKAWNIIATTLDKELHSLKTGSAATNATTVAFTENLMRNIVSLDPDQQLELVKDLAEGNINKGKFKARAEAYKTRNEIKEFLKEQLASYGEENMALAFEEVDKGVYDKEWVKHQKDGTNTTKLNKLVDAIRDNWENKNNTTFIHGDFYEEIKTIPDGSIDLVLTDPPYNISRENVFKLNGRKNVTQNFGEWDHFEHHAFVELFKVWAQEFNRILRDGGSGYVFTSDDYVSHLRDALKESGLNPKATIVWHKTNPMMQVVQTSYRSSIEHIIFFTKGVNHTLNWQGDNEMHNFIEGTKCQGNERTVDAKGDTLHPTQKPEYLIRHFMEISSNKGDMIFMVLQEWAPWPR